MQLQSCIVLIIIKWKCIKHKQRRFPINLKFVDVYQDGKSYITIAKMVGQSGRKFRSIVTFFKSGRPTQITPRAEQLIVHKVSKEPWIISKQIMCCVSYLSWHLESSKGAYKHLTLVYCYFPALYCNMIVYLQMKSSDGETAISAKARVTYLSQGNVKCYSTNGELTLVEKSQGCIISILQKKKKKHFWTFWVTSYMIC